MNCSGSSHKWPPEPDVSEVSCAFQYRWSRLRFGGMSWFWVCPPRGGWCSALCVQSSAAFHFPRSSAACSRFRNYGRRCLHAYQYQLRYIYFTGVLSRQASYALLDLLQVKIDGRCHRVWKIQPMQKCLKPVTLESPARVWLTGRKKNSVSIEFY